MIYTHFQHSSFLHNLLEIKQISIAKLIDKNDPKGISFHMEIENKNLKMNLNSEFKMENLSNLF